MIEFISRASLKFRFKCVSSEGHEWLIHLYDAYELLQHKCTCIQTTNFQISAHEIYTIEKTDLSIEQDVYA